MEYAEQHPVSIYKRIFGTEEPSADTIICMVNVLNKIRL